MINNAITTEHSALATKYNIKGQGTKTKLTLEYRYGVP